MDVWMALDGSHTGQVTMSVDTRTARPSRILVVIGALLVVSTACSGADGGASSAPGTTPGQSESTVVATDRVPFGRQSVEWMQTIEQGTSQCMAERGFEYIPYIAQNVVDDFLAMDEAATIEVYSPGLDDLVLMLPEEPAREEFIAELAKDAAINGFGVFIAPVPVAEDDPNPRDRSSNPNRPITDAMSDQEEAEYYRALQGYATEDVTDDGQFVGGSRDTPCLEVGREAAGPEPEPPNQLDGIDVDRLFALGERVYRLAHADPAMAGAYEAFAACLAERGAPPDPYEYIGDLWNRALDEANPDGLFEYTGDGPAADLVHNFGEEKLREYQEIERAMAVIAYECLIARNVVERRLLLQYQEEALRAEPDIATMLGIDLDG